MSARIRRHANRGQAFVETVIFLPVFLIILFGVIWIVQTTVVNERLQSAVRYSGLVSNETSPYSAYSLYSLYENVEYPNSIPKGPQCVAPMTGILSNSAPFPGPTSPPFWQPFTTGTPTCTPGYTTMTGSNFTQPAIFDHTVSQISATTRVPSYLSSGAHALPQSQPLVATQKFFSAPDMGTMFACYSSVTQLVAASLEHQSGSTVSAPAMINPGGSGPPLVSSC
ncbi:MAG: pilus assembly protein [Candidatus Eremiobacteraeota bacterium]|nr:pilus assembly protein [Candidatus Eremiobacteraeota bacterium]